MEEENDQDDDPDEEEPDDEVAEEEDDHHQVGKYFPAILILFSLIKSFFLTFFQETLVQNRRKSTFGC